MSIFQKAIAKHPWRLEPSEAISLQKQLATDVRIEKCHHPLRMIAGVDSAFSKDGTQCLAAAVLWDSEKGEVVSEATAIREVTMPYIPGLLSFREGSAFLAALDALGDPIDAVMCDGQGLAHQRRLGIACHLGVLTGVPMLGCGKTRLVGTYEEPEVEKGAHSPLVDKGTKIGAVVRTRTNVKPVFISPGHLMNVDDAIDVALSCACGYRLPEPTRRADQLAAKFKREFTSPADPEEP